MAGAMPAPVTAIRPFHAARARSAPARHDATHRAETMVRQGRQAAELMEMVSPAGFEPHML
jgi:hypothetical protein